MFYSQDNQDRYLETHVFKGYKNGIFIDVGAHNGKTINNTLYFEENNNWIASKDYLKTSSDGVFVKLITPTNPDDKKPMPKFEDVFKIKEL